MYSNFYEVSLGVHQCHFKSSVCVFPLTVVQVPTFLLKEEITKTKYIALLKIMRNLRITWKVSLNIFKHWETDKVNQYFGRQQNLNTIWHSDQDFMQSKLVTPAMSLSIRNLFISDDISRCKASCLLEFLMYPVSCETFAN